MRCSLAIICFVYKTYNYGKGLIVGILKISDQLHDEIRSSSRAMSRSINAQAEFWIRVGRLCELNPQHTYAEILQQFLMPAQSLNSERPETEQ